MAPSFPVESAAAGVHDAAEIARAISVAANESDRGLIVLPDTIMSHNRKLIADLAARYRLPAVYPFRYLAGEGGLVSYAVDTVEIYRGAASYIGRILRGAKAADLLVQAPTKFEMVINLKTAKALGLTVPSSMLARAGEVIE